MKLKIDIDVRTFIKFWMVLLAFVIGILALYSARSALILVLISFFLALALNYPVHKIASVFPGKKQSSRLAGTFAAYVLVVGVIFLCIKLIVPPLVEQSNSFIQSVPNIIEENQSQVKVVRDFIDKYDLQPKIDKAIDNTKHKTEDWISGSFANDVMSSLTTLGNIIVSTLLVLVMTFLMLLEGPTWLEKLWKTYKDKKRRDHHKELADKMYEVVKSYVNGQIVVSLIAGICSGVTIFLISIFIPEVPNSLSLPAAAFAALFSLIPMLGAFISGTIITIILALNSITAAIIFLIYFVIYQQVEANFIVPTVQSKTLKLSALAILISITIGTFTIGLAGGIISIPIAGWIKILIEDYLKNRPDSEDKKESKAAKLIKKFSNNSSKA